VHDDLPIANLTCSSGGDGAFQPRRPQGRSLSDFRLDGTATPHGLLPAEERLLEAAARGEPCALAEAAPSAPSKANRIRPGFLRFLLLGGDGAAPVHEKRVELRGAYIDGGIDLDECQGVRAFRLVNCRMDGRLTAVNASMAELRICGGAVRGLDCSFAKFSGGVYLIDGLTVTGETSFLGASIDGRLACNKSRFSNPGGVALTCAAATITSDVYLMDGFIAEGGTRFTRASIGGVLACAGGVFRNPTARSSSRGSDANFADYALDLTGVQINGVLWLGPSPVFNLQVIIEGSLNLQGAQVRALFDDPGSWPAESVEAPGAGRLPCVISLDDFTYERLIRGAPADAATRRRWLLRQRPSHLGDSFRPHPFEQLAGVLRAMGHEHDAREIAMLKQSFMTPLRASRTAGWRRPFVRFIGWFWGVLCGYGYRPHRLVGFLFALWLGCAAVYELAAKAGAFVPGDAQAWADEKLAAECDANWTQCAKMKKSAPFNALAYSADVLLPIIDFKQRSAWTPARGPVRVLVWTENLLGSLGVLLLGAILGGLVKRD
jgi:hypothetical protein